MLPALPPAGVSWAFLRAVGSGASPGIPAVGSRGRLTLKNFLADTSTGSRSWKLSLA